MDSALITGMAAVLGSLSGAMASIATTWMTQRSQKVRERAQAELRRRETLYGEFITESFRLTADAFEHSLERPDTLANVYSTLARIQLVASDGVVETAENCCAYLVELYARPVMTKEQIYETLRVSEHPIRAFSAACREELEHYAKQ